MTDQEPDDHEDETPYDGDAADAWEQENEERSKRRPRDAARPSSTVNRVPPHNIEAERALLGAALISKSAIKAANDVVTPGDFYRPAHGHIFQVLVDLWGRGQTADLVTVTEELTRRDLADVTGGMDYIADLLGAAPGTSNAGHYGRIVSDHATLRRLIGVAGHVIEQAYGVPQDVGDLVEETLAMFVETQAAVISTDIGGLSTMDEFLDRPQDQRPPWVIPGLIRMLWRVMIVAGEGAGKTVLLRQFALAAAQGVHPLNFQPIDPVRALIVDLENPDDSIVEVCNPIRLQAGRVVGDKYDPDRAWLWHRPGGVNLRNRRDRAELEAVIARTKPDLVVLGPVYKAYATEGMENDERAVREVMAVFDDLRTRYRFALMLEHHAPQGSKGSRDIRPYGSSLWLRWPELGLSLQAKGTDGIEMGVGRFRGDRLENGWPISIKRTADGVARWPWEGLWPSGTFRAPGEPPVRLVEDVLGPEPPIDEPPDDYFDSDNGRPPY